MIVIRFSRHSINGPFTYRAVRDLEPSDLELLLCNDRVIYWDLIVCENIQQLNQFIKLIDQGADPHNVTSLDVEVAAMAKATRHSNYIREYAMETLSDACTPLQRLITMRDRLNEAIRQVRRQGTAGVTVRELLTIVAANSLRFIVDNSYDGDC